MSDIYDQAVEYLSDLVLEDDGDTAILWDTWENPSTQKGGVLFEFTDRYRSGECGCLTQVRSGEYDGPTAELTERIRADDRLPNNGSGITVEMLPVFAEWQRKIDAELGRETPTHI